MKLTEGARPPRKEEGNMTKGKATGRTKEEERIRLDAEHRAISDECRMIEEEQRVLIDVLADYGGDIEYSLANRPLVQAIRDREYRLDETFTKLNAAFARLTAAEKACKAAKAEAGQ
jgi:hypothetical protein